MSLGLIKSLARFINSRKKVGTDRASMILRKHEQSVLQSLCSIYQHFLDLFISLYAIHIHWKCAKLKKIKACKIHIIKDINPNLIGNTEREYQNQHKT